MIQISEEISIEESMTFADFESLAQRDRAAAVAYFLYHKVARWTQDDGWEEVVRVLGLWFERGNNPYRMPVDEFIAWAKEVIFGDEEEEGLSCPSEPFKCPKCNASLIATQKKELSFTFSYTGDTVDRYDSDEDWEFSCPRGCDLGESSCCEEHRSIVNPQSKWYDVLHHAIEGTLTTQMIIEAQKKGDADEQETDQEPQAALA